MFKQFLKEGGAAIKKTVRINQLNVSATIKDIQTRLFPELGIAISDTVLLGSTGKKDPKLSGSPEGSSGDIDMAVNIKALGDDIKEITKKIEAAADKLGVKMKAMTGINVISLGWPIMDVDGKQAGEIVQLDLMPVNDLEYAAWSYYSPAYDESLYKGLFRNEILYAVAKYAQFEVTDNSHDGKPVEWSRLFYDLSKGLMKGKQSLVGKNQAILANPYTTEKEILTTNPTEICSILFGPDVKPSDVLTWEDTLQAILSPSFLHKDQLDKILPMIASGIQNKKQPIPDDLKVLL